MYKCIIDGSIVVELNDIKEKIFIIKYLKVQKYLVNIVSEDWKLCCGCIFVIFLLFAGFSLISNVVSHWHWDNYDTNDVVLTDYKNEVINSSYVFLDGHIDYEYDYSISFLLKNVSAKYIGSEVVTYFYNGNELIISDTNGLLSNNTTNVIKEEYFHEDYTSVHPNYHLNNLTNITHVVIVIIKDGKVLFNTTQHFNMDNYRDFVHYQKDNSSDGNSSTSIKSSSNTAHTYVASGNSNKFHEPSCSQANRIKDSNRITFSTRDEAISAGYSPCNICNP